jgi:hypothetical protein
MEPGNDEQTQDEGSHGFQADEQSPPRDGNPDLPQVMIKAVKHTDIA